jgi:hypothetical protein
LNDPLPVTEVVGGWSHPAACEFTVTFHVHEDPVVTVTERVPAALDTVSPGAGLVVKVHEAGAAAWTTEYVALPDAGALRLTVMVAFRCCGSGLVVG